MHHPNQAFVFLVNIIAGWLNRRQQKGGAEAEDRPVAVGLLMRILLRILPVRI